MPVFEFRCRGCDARFEELVGAHVGTEVTDVRCPECGSAEVERLTGSGFASLHRQATPNQRRRMEDKRGTDRGGAMDRFRKQRKAEKRGRGGGRGA